MNQQFVLTPIPLDDLVNKLTESISNKVLSSIAEQQQKDKEAKFISTDEVCNLFEPRITRMTVHNWVNKGVLNKKVIGGKVCFSLAEVIAATKTLKKYKREVSSHV